MGIYGKMSQESMNQLLKGAAPVKEKDKSGATPKPTDKSTTPTPDGTNAIMGTPGDMQTRGGDTPDQVTYKLKLEVDAKEQRIRELEEQLKRCGNTPVVKDSSCCTIV